MPNATKTAPAVSGSQLRHLRDEAQRYHETAEATRERAESMVTSFRKDGVDVSRGTAKDAVTALFRESQEAADRAAELRDQYTAALEAMDGGVGARGQRMPSYSFDDSDLQRLRSAAKEGGNLTVQARTVTTVQAPQAAETLYSGTEGSVRERFRVASLIPTQQVSTSSVTWYRSVVPAAAGTVAEGANKPESTPSYEPVVSTMRKLATVAKATTEVFDDWSEFERIVEDELVASVIALESQQILNGTGLGTELPGLFGAAGNNIARDEGESLLDVLSRAITAVRTETGGKAEPNAILLHPSDYHAVVTSKDGQERYHHGAAFSGAPGTIWGVRAYPSTDVAAGSALVADMDKAARIFLRQPVEASVNHTPGWDEWQANEILLRAEERLALAVVLPEALAAVDLS